MRLLVISTILSLFVGTLASAKSEPEATAPAINRAAIRQSTQAVLGTLPIEAANSANLLTDAKIDLGRMLYYDARLSKNHDIACNSCHGLSTFGVDNEPTSPGHRGQRGGRNSPTVYNAAFHITQFWDGRAEDVEEQAKGPILNPIEMAMPDEARVLAVIESIPGYPPLFAAAFPKDPEPLSYENLARAIGAFERRLVTPSRFDAFLDGDDDALSERELAGLQTFVRTGCITCHMGPVIGGSMYQKLGLVVPFPSEDPGREAVTGNATDRGFFKVPSLRNIAMTGPYFHDGSVETLDHAIRLMAKHQLGKTLDDTQVDAIRSFLQALTGSIDPDYIAKPKLPPSGPTTPRPDPR